MTIENFFDELFNFLDLFFWSINQGFKLFFNDILIFDIAIGWWFLLFAVIGLITYRIGGH